MKIERFRFILLLLTLCLICSKSDTFPNINLIISYKLNGTAAFASLEYVNPSEKYIYFSFDFKYHNSAVSQSKNKAYFSIDSDFELMPPDKEKITFGFSEKNWNEIKSNKDIENIDWKKIEYKFKERQYDNRNYYYEVERKNDEMKTMLIRVPINGKNEGYITIENIQDFSFLKN